MQDTKDRLITILTEQFGDSVANDAREGREIFVDHGRGWADGSLDSLDKVEFVMAVEDEFHISVPDYAIRDFRLLDDVATFVDAQRTS